MNENNECIHHHVPPIPSSRRRPSTAVRGSLGRDGPFTPRPGFAPDGTIRSTVTERLPAQIHELAGNVNLQQQRLRVSDTEPVPEAPGPEQEQTPLPAAIPVPRAKGKGSRMLIELVSDLGPEMALQTPDGEGRGMFIYLLIIQHRARRLWPV